MQSLTRGLSPGLTCEPRSVCASAETDLQVATGPCPGMLHAYVALGVHRVLPVPHGRYSASWGVAGGVGVSPLA